jgi:hypothetical protein
MVRHALPVALMSPTNPLTSMGITITRLGEADPDDATVARLEAAAHELAAAWQAIPPDAREAIGDLTLVLHGVQGGRS